MKSTSPNQRYELRVSQGIIDGGERVDDGVTLRRDGDIQFEKSLRAPSKGAVANNGTSIVVQGKNWDKAEEEWEEDDRFDTFYIYTATGELLTKRDLETSSGIFGCAIDGAGAHIALSGPDEGNVVLFNVETGNRICSRSYEEIDLAFEINAIQNDDEWVFELVDTSEQTEIFINTVGEVIPESDVSPGKSDEEPSAGSKEPIAEVLRQRDIPVPDTVFGLPFGQSGANHSEGVNKERFEKVIDQGPVYDPEWSEYKFVIPDPPKVLYVLGVKSVSEAAEAFNTFCDVEQIDLSEWYQVGSTSGTMTPSSSDFETALRRVSKVHAGDSGLDIEEGVISFDTDTVLNNVVRDVFFGDESTSDSSGSIQLPVSRFPDNEFGETLQRIVSGESTPYSSHGVTSVSGYNRLVEDSPVQQIIDGFPDLLDLLESGTIFEPYSIDLRNASPSAQPLFDIVAKESPETVFQHLDWLEDHLLEHQSITAPEVSCRILQTVVEEHPDRFEELIPVLDTVLESKSAHPQRRALNIVETGLRNGVQNSVCELKIADGSIIEHLLKRMQVTESAWLLAACCSVISEHDLTSEDYDRLEDHSELLINTLRRGGSRRGEQLSKGLGGPLMHVSTDKELLERIRSLEASGEALYRLNKYSAGPVLRELASERPESVLLHLEPLMEDFTSTNGDMKEVRKVAKRILRSTVENLPEEQYEVLSQYDSEVLPLLQSEDRHDVNFALEWARRSRSEEAVDALAEIHENDSDDRWQRATAILDEIASNRVDPEIEPDNTHTAWIEFVVELAEKRGQLPASSDVTEHPDSPKTPFWEVFDG